jgi:hypothetical protein
VPRGSAAAWRSDTPVAVSPATVLVTSRCIVTADVADSHGGVITAARSNKTAGEDAERRKPDEANLPRREFNAHFGSTLLSVSVHSINPMGAPIGSAITAIFPPSRSTYGSTSSRPPNDTAFAEDASASTTRMKLSQ